MDSPPKHGENAHLVAFLFKRVLLQTHLTEAEREKKREPNVFDVQRWDGWLRGQPRGFETLQLSKGDKCVGVWGTKG
jgi:hypothetical protein